MQKTMDDYVELIIFNQIVRSISPVYRGSIDGENGQEQINSPLAERLSCKLVDIDERTSRFVHCNSETEILETAVHLGCPMK